MSDKQTAPAEEYAWTSQVHPDGDDQLAKVFPHERYLLAAAAAADPLTSTEKRNARALLTKFALASELHRSSIHYTQARPFDPSVNPEAGYRGDCSSYITQAFYWAANHLGGAPLHDPSGPVEYDGWGYTGTLLATNHGHRIPLERKFFVGDIALYGTFWATRHVVLCRKGGYEAAAVWSSHGSEAGPNPVRLRYRPDLLGVYRPHSLL